MLDRRILKTGLVRRARSGRPRKAARRLGPPDLGPDPTVRPGATITRTQRLDDDRRNLRNSEILNPAGSVSRTMPPMECIVGFVTVFRSDEQLGSTDRRVHTARVVSPNHALDADLVQNALGDLSIGRRPECRDGDQL